MPDVFVKDDSKQPKTKTKTIPKKTGVPKTVQTTTPIAPAAPVTAAPTIKPVKPVSFFTSFSHFPEGIKFSYQEIDEDIILFLRRHYTQNIRWVALSIILIFLPLILLLFGNLINSVLIIIPLRFIIIFIAFYYLIVIGYIFISFITWFYNVGIITNKQIIDIDFSDIMYRSIAKARIEEIVDVEFSQGGFLQSFFDFGNVTVQTEGVKPNFEFNNIPYPDKATDIILDLIGKTKKHG